jgi:hypothetical protein
MGTHELIFGKTHGYSPARQIPFWIWLSPLVTQVLVTGTQKTYQFLQQFLIDLKNHMLNKILFHSDKYKQSEILDYLAIYIQELHTGNRWHQNITKCSIHHPITLIAFDSDSEFHEFSHVLSLQTPQKHFAAFTLVSLIWNDEQWEGPDWRRRGDIKIIFIYLLIKV